MKAVAQALILIFVIATAVWAQSPITTIALGADKIGEVRTALGITTRITFPEAVQEVICGDLYDPASGKGTFVIQRSGTADRPGNDIFLKPVATKGISNMFVKTGDGKHTYSFDLTIVQPAQAHRVVNITDPSVQQPADSTPHNAGSNTGGAEKPATDGERPKPEVDPQVRVKADEILRNARQQADRIVGEAESKVSEMEREWARRADEETDKRFLQSLILGVREEKIDNPRASTKAINIMLDPQRVMLFDNRAYLRYVIQNISKKDFSFASLALLSGEAKDASPVTIEITQSKADNSLAPGESLTGVIAFDPKVLTTKTKLILYVRGEGDAEITRVTIQ